MTARFTARDPRPGRRPGPAAWCAVWLLALGAPAWCAEPAPEPTVVTWFLPVALDRELYEGLVERFNAERDDIRVEASWVPSTQYRSKFKILAAAGQAPDVFTVGDVWVAYLLPFLRDITDFVQRDADEIDLLDFYPEIREACQYEGRYYYMPTWFNLSLLYYNRRIFDEAGEPYPAADWTWDDYLAAAQRLTQRDEDGRARIWGTANVVGWWGEWLILVRQSGGRLFNESLTRCLLDTPEAIRGMQFYYDRIHKYEVSPQPGYGPSAGFASGRIAMMLGGHTGDWPIYNASRNLPEWDIQILPRGPATREGGEIALEAFGISKDCEHPEAAWELLKFIVSKQGIRGRVEAGFLSVRRSVAEEMLLNEDRTDDPRSIDAVYRQLPYARPIPRSPDYIEIAIEIIQPEIDLMMSGRYEPAQACRRAAAAANRFIEVLGRR